MPLLLNVNHAERTSDGVSCTKVAFIVSTRPSEAVQCLPVLGAAVEAICYDKGIDSFHFLC